MSANRARAALVVEYSAPLLHHHTFALFALIMSTDVLDVCALCVSGIRKLYNHTLVVNHHCIALCDCDVIAVRPFPRCCWQASSLNVCPAAAFDSDAEKRLFVGTR